MKAPSSSTIWVSPDYESYPLRFIGAAIGHELVHIKAHLDDNVDLRNNKSPLTDSEREAYAWVTRNSRKFELTIEEKTAVLLIAKKYNK